MKIIMYIFRKWHGQADDTVTKLYAVCPEISQNERGFLIIFIDFLLNLTTIIFKYKKSKEKNAYSMNEMQKATALAHIARKAGAAPTVRTENAAIRKTPACGVTAIWK